MSQSRLTVQAELMDIADNSYNFRRLRIGGHHIHVIHV
jgi:hypothetical protein